MFAPGAESGLHLIRLHGPWKAMASAECGMGNEESARSVPHSPFRIPHLNLADLSAEVGQDSMVLERSFNRPTNLAADQQVWLVVESVGLIAGISLNENPLGALPNDGHFRASIGNLLKPANRIRIALSSATNWPTAAISTVRLEIG